MTTRWFAPLAAVVLALLPATSLACAPSFRFAPPPVPVTVDPGPERAVRTLSSDRVDAYKRSLARAGWSPTRTRAASAFDRIPGQRDGLARAAALTPGGQGTRTTTAPRLGGGPMAVRLDGVPVSWEDFEVGPSARSFERR